MVIRKDLRFIVVLNWTETDGGPRQSRELYKGTDYALAERTYRENAEGCEPGYEETVTMLSEWIPQGWSEA